MIKQILRNTALSALVIAVLSGGYGATAGNELAGPSPRASQGHDDHDRWDG